MNRLSLLLESPENIWLALAKPITNSWSHKVNIAHFGIEPFDTNELWLFMHKEVSTTLFDARHLLWTLYFMKTLLSSISVILSHLQCSEKAFWKWTTMGLELICKCLPEVPKV
jgi:hypothetical protein